MDLIFFGIQGAGKGTQSTNACNRYHLKTFETGAALRSLAQEDSDLGRKVKSIIEAGNLVPTEVVMEIVEDFINKNGAQGGILFDGIPRSPEQAEAFLALMEKNEREFTPVLINLSKEEAKKRLLLRQRKDDYEDAINTRFNHYEAQTIPVIDTLRKNHAVVEINGDQSIEAVEAEINHKLDPLYGHTN